MLGLSSAGYRPPRPSPSASCLRRSQRPPSSQRRAQHSNPHGGGETGDPLAGFESLVDECSRERARQSDPEHNRQASDLIFQGHSLADLDLLLESGELF